jgi:endonuclease G
MDATSSTPVYAIIIPNTTDVKGTKWFQYMVSVDEVERQTGYDFLRDVPDDVENVIEARVATPPGLR